MQDAASFDYVIIGGGSAGCVLANRLSEDQRNRVCLIEAGPSDRSYWVRSCNPINMLYLMNSRRYNWRYLTEPDAANGGRRFYWPRGRGLGGSSSINAMIYTRGHPRDYDHWAELGNEGWDFASVMPWFRKSERQQRGADDFHGADGTMDVVDTNFRYPASEAFVRACEQAGFPHNPDFNGPSQEGCGFYQVTQTVQGRRCNAATAFLDEAMDRPNLTILTGAQATRILFDGRTATGVEYADPRRRRRRGKIMAQREVILSAGVINSPQLLKLSGIGPAAELRALGIPVIHDLPGVGENLQDHPDIMLICRDKSRTSFSAMPGPHTGTFLRRYFGRSQPFVFTPTDCGGFIRSDPAEPIPDLQLQFAAVHMRPHGRGLSNTARFGFVLHICHLRPESRGRVLLRSADPFDAPKIVPNYLAAEKEVEALVKGIRIGRHILSQPAMERVFGRESLPGPAIATDEQLRSFLRTNVETVYHTAGSCKMGTDPLAVVGPDLRLHGIDGLRVIDSSVMPTITGSNIHAPTVMIAERGAHMILNGCTAREAVLEQAGGSRPRESLHA